MKKINGKIVDNNNNIHDSLERTRLFEFGLLWIRQQNKRDEMEHNNNNNEWTNELSN